MSVSQGRLLDPVRDEKEIYPYRRVWASLITAHAILFIVAGVIYAFTNFLGISLPATLQGSAGIVFIFLPVALWLILSVLPERRALRPRQRLIIVFIITALATNAVALPIVNDFLQPDQWLPLENAINRIVGYTFTLGIVQETVKYVILRYTVWQDHLRIRADAVAYSVAAALGFATVQNIQFMLNNPGTSLDVIAFRVVENVAINIAASLFVSLGLSETRFDHPTPFFMTITVALGALITGIAQPILKGLVNAPFSVSGVFPRPLFGFGFAVALFAGAVFVTLFLYSAAERRDQDRTQIEGVR